MKIGCFDRMLGCVFGRVCVCYLEGEVLGQGLGVTVFVR